MLNVQPEDKKAKIHYVLARDYTRQATADSSTFDTLSQFKELAYRAFIHGRSQ